MRAFDSRGRHVRHRGHPGLTIDQGTTIMYETDPEFYARRAAADVRNTYAVDNDGKLACDTHGAHDPEAGHAFAECPMFHV